MRFKDFINQKIVYAVIPILPIIVILYVTDSYYTDINELKTEYTENIENLESQKYVMINSIINNRINQAKNQNNKMMIDLDNSFAKMYNNDRDDAITNDIENLHSDLIINILTAVIVKDYELTKLYDAIDPDNIVFMTNKHGIIEFRDNSHVRQASFIRFKNWEIVIDSKINKPLAERAVHEIMSMTNSTIFWESMYATKNKPEKRYSQPSMNYFQEIINTNDVNEWKYYNILVPSYMYINHSPKDLIIVREINMYKMLEPYIHSIIKYDTMVEEYKFDMTRLVFGKILSCLGIAVTLLASFFLALCSALENIKEKR